MKKIKWIALVVLGWILFEKAVNDYQTREFWGHWRHR